MEPIVVGIADCAMADVPGQVPTTHALGSCSMFADTGIAVVLEQVAADGAGRLAAHMAGGAQVIDGDDVLEIGKRNYSARGSLRRRLRKRRGLWPTGS